MIHYSLIYFVMMELHSDISTMVWMLCASHDQSDPDIRVRAESSTVAPDTSLSNDGHRWEPISAAHTASSPIFSDLVGPLSGNFSLVINERKNVNRVQNSYQASEVINNRPSLGNFHPPYLLSRGKAAVVAFLKSLNNHQIRKIF